MEITGAQVMELRKKTGAGVADCKKALTETNGDMDKAVDFLREKEYDYVIISHSKTDSFGRNTRGLWRSATIWSGS